MQPKLQSQLEPKPLGLELNHHSKLIFIGSCFAEHIGEKLRHLKFNCQINPLGISYNPVSLLSLMQRSLNDERFLLEELLHHNERHFSFDLHSSFSNSNAIDFLKKANDQLELQLQQLQTADCLFISLGTAWVHIFKQKGILVNNCHKLPAAEFEKSLLSVSDVVGAWERFYERLKELNPKLKVIFTVSPVRHLKDGFRENQLSKSILHLAVEKIYQKFDNVFYFPSFEIMMDELRDYRYYDRDLVHPNQLAIDLIWEHFQLACLSQKSRQSVVSLEKMQAAIAHRPFDFESQAHLEFLQKLLVDLRAFTEKTGVDMQAETLEIKSRIEEHM